MTLSLAALVLVAFTAVAVAEEAAAQEHAYVGVDGCKMCHKKEADGDQYGKWAAGPHAGAYKTLATEEAKKVAAEAGIEGDPQQAAECLSCHVTAFAVKDELKGKKFSMEDGVGCESCHGPGEDYKSMKVMKDHEAAVAAGLLAVDKDTCVQCHNEKSPTFKGFEYEAMLAKVAHPNPNK
jgi:hypothetical protein